MIADSQEFPFGTPEAIASLPWTETNPSGIAALRAFASSTGLILHTGALRGGRFLSPVEGSLPKPDREHLANARSIAVIPAIEGESPEFNRIIYFPTDKKERHFSANLAAYRSSLAAYVAENWDTNELGPPPIPQALTTHKLDAGYVTITEYRAKIQGLGEGGPAAGLHQLDIRQLPIDKVPRLVAVLDAIHVRSKEFQRWVEQRNIVLPEGSWLSPKNAKCALRGQEWWYNPEGTVDRLRELKGKASSDSVKGKFQETIPDFNTKLESMIKNNLALYPHQDGSIDDPELVGETVVVHGTLYPDNIHESLDPKSGRTIYTITGGDRSQAFGLRGQMIDWLVSACASSPEHQKVLVDAFINLHGDMKERRGLAMHVMYRCVMDTPWFVENGKLEEARNLVKLASQILNGEGIWEGVNTPLIRNE